MRTAILALVAASAFGQGTVTLDINPTPEHRRNSEGSFVTLASGRVLFVYTQFYGGSGDDAPARLVGIHSDDGGRTWSKPVTVLENTAGNNVMSVSLLRLKSGKIAMFYLRKDSWITCKPYMQVSTDEAKTWSEPKPVFTAPGYFVLNNDRVVQLSTGRLIVPVAYHRSRAADPASSKSFDGRGIAMWWHSDDEGATWQESASWWAMPRVSGSGMQEPGVVEVADGSLFTFVRTDQGEQWGMRSSDRGHTWSAPEPTSMKSPVSPASIERFPGSSDLLAVFNDHSGQFKFPEKKRTPLVTAVSTDDGRTWGSRKLIEPDPEGWYCYTAIHWVDGAVLLGYAAGDTRVGRLNRLRIRRIPLAELR